MSVAKNNIASEFASVLRSIREQGLLPEVPSSATRDALPTSPTAAELAAAAARNGSVIASGTTYTGDPVRIDTGAVFSAWRDVLESMHRDDQTDIVQRFRDYQPGRTRDARLTSTNEAMRARARENQQILAVQERNRAFWANGGR
jgi:hypothetical protein